MITNQEVVQNQSKNFHLTYFRVDESLVSAVTPGPDGLLEGAYHADVFKNGAGDYSFTLKRTGRRLPVIIGAVAIGVVDVRPSITELTTSGFRIVWELSGTDTVTDFHVTLGCFGDLVPY